MTQGVRFYLFLLTIAIGWPEFALAKEQTFVVGGNHAPPYRIIETSADGNLQFGGIYFDIIKEVADRAGIKIIFKRAPFKRVLAMMEKGKHDIMVGPNRTDEREKYMHYIDVPMSAEPKAFYTHSFANDITKFDDLEEKTIGVLRGAKYFREFDQDDTLHKKPFNDYVTAFTVLSKTRIDVVISPEMQGDYTVAKNFSTNIIRKASYRSAGHLSYVTISRKSPLFIKRDQLAEALRSVVHDGTYNSIVERYR